MTTRELIERAREWTARALEHFNNDWYSPTRIKGSELLAAIDAHLSEPQQTTLPVEIYGKLYDVPIPVQVHIVSLGVQIKQADERGDEALRRAHECERLAEIAQPDDHKVLAWEVKRLADAYGGSTSSENKESRRKLHEAIDRLAAQPVQEPAGDAQPWRPFGLTLEAALNRGDDPALLMDENSPLRGELRRLLYAPLAPPTAPVEQPPVGWQTVWVNNFLQLIGALKRADQKGYMPDAMREEWDDFEWSIRGGTASVEQPAQAVPYPAAYIEHHKAGDNLVWTVEKPMKNVTPLYTHPAAPSAQPTPTAQAKKEGE